MTTFSLVELLNDRTVVALSTAIALIGFIWPDIQRRYRIGILGVAGTILAVSITPLAFPASFPVTATGGDLTAIRSYVEPIKQGCGWAITEWSDGNASAVPLNQQCKSAAVRANSSARLVRVFNQLTEGREWTIAQWTDNTYTCALRSQPSNTVIIKPQGCSW